MNVIGHFTTITEHKIMVMRHCFRIGLYWQGLTHDLSKYTPVEFLQGIKYYQGTCSPNNAERMDKGYSAAWLHHKGRNRHHFEYWIDYSTDKAHPGMTGMRMPRRYVAEMLADRIAASKVYNKGTYTDHDPLAYYLKGKDHYMIHPKTQRELEFLLRYLDRYGEDECFRFVREVYLKRKSRRKAKMRVSVIRGYDR